MIILKAVFPLAKFSAIMPATLDCTCLGHLGEHDHRILRKIDGLMAHTTCLVCLVSTVSGCHKNALGRGSTSSRHITKLEQSLDIYGHDKDRIISICVTKPWQVRKVVLCHYIDGVFTNKLRRCTRA
jgi:hypothetical protein